MGAGNWLPGNRNELLDWQGFYVDYKGIYGERYFEDEIYDDGEDLGELADFMDYVIYELNKRFPDLEEVQRSRGRDETIHMEDGIIQLVMGDNESSVAVYMLLVETYDDEIDTEKEGEKYGDYLDGLKEILLEYCPGFVYERTGAWTSAKIG